MKILDNYDEISHYVRANIANYYRTEKLIPFFGAGFTKGSKSKRGIVPDSKECTEKMKALIQKYSPSLSDDLVKENSFEAIANLFYKLVPTSAIEDFLFDNFSNVRLPKIKEQIINLDWKFVYTLNVDDAIERCSRFKPILPNKPLQKKFLRNIQPVYKLHGDAQEEIVYLSKKGGVIFSRKQYLQSLTENKDLLNIFFEDYSRLNVLFIGCSLDNELDLEYIFANNTLVPPANSDKIYITSSKPTALKALKLEDLGINICLVIDNYDKFYQLLIDELTSIPVELNLNLGKYIISKTERGISTKYNQAIVCGSSDVLIENNKVVLPSFFCHRTKTDEIIKEFTTANMIFLIGKRVSGKTFLLYDIIDRISNTTIYLFRSRISLDSEVLDNISELENCILLFDTDTISSVDIEELYYNNGHYISNNVKFLFCINSSDKLMLSVPYTRLIDTTIFELDNKFNREEVEHLNTGLSRLGLSKSQSGSNLLSNIFRFRDIYKVSNNYAITKDINPKVLKIYILNATFDKVYSSIYRALKIDYDNLSYAITTSERALEFEYDLSTLEFNQHANFKVITNSKSYIFNSLGLFISRHQHLPLAVNAIVEIVQTLMQYENFKNQWTALITFDTLNQIFLTDSKGAMNLIFQTYDKLEHLLFKDTHYWLQRAKSIYYLKRDNETELLNAILYTQKSYFDSTDNSRMKTSSSFQLAMIYNRLLAINEYKNKNYLQEGVKWNCIGLKENQHNTKFLSDFIERALQEKNKNDFYRLAIYLFDTTDKVDKDDRDFIVGKLFKR